MSTFSRDILFEKCNVSNWADVVRFFQSTYDKFGPIDAVISNAGINDADPLDDLSAETTKTSDLEAPNLSVLQVNMIGTWYVTKCAIHFFDKHPETSSQLVLFGSVASFFDTPPLYTYCASKAAVLGLMRALRSQLPRRNITVNMIAPWMTGEISSVFHMPLSSSFVFMTLITTNLVTAMVTGHIQHVWDNMPANQPVDVARASLLPIIRPETNGKSFLINGGNITELEDKLDETQHIWLGPDLDKDMREGQRRLIP